MREGELAIDPARADDLIAVARIAGAHGWVPATSGNFSVRLDERTCAITRSGTDKGNLTRADFVAIGIETPVPQGVSAEAPLHLERYRASAATAAVLHVHTVPATVLSRADAARGNVALDGFEMHKALAGHTTHEGVVQIPVFANDQDVAALAHRVGARLGAEPPVPGYLLAGHGLYAWGTSVAQAQRHLEGLVFLLECALEERRMHA